MNTQANLMHEIVSFAVNLNGKNTLFSKGLNHVHPNSFRGFSELFTDVSEIIKKFQSDDVVSVWLAVGFESQGAVWDTDPLLCVTSTHCRRERETFTAVMDQWSL